MRKLGVGRISAEQAEKMVAVLTKVTWARKFPDENLVEISTLN